MKSNYKSILNYLLLIIILASCQENNSIRNRYVYVKPKYNSGITVSTDTLQFKFPDTLYHKIKSFNVFVSAGKEYLSMFDRKKQVIFIYDLDSRRCVAHMPLSSFITITNDFFTTSFVNNFDSIFVFDDKNVQLFDTNHVLKNKIAYLKGNRPQVLFYTLGNTPLFIDHKFYTGVESPLDIITTSDLKKQKVLYEFDLEKDSAYLHYSLPDVYYEDYYSYQYLSRNFCHNSDGNFVFSFALDSNIYETNLQDLNIAYYGKSRYQEGWIQPVSKKEVVNPQSRNKNYALNDAYGGIYIDEFNNLYLRVAYKKMTEQDYAAKKKNRQQSLIIFDQEFKIIGETPISNNIDLSKLFITPSGRIYALLENKDFYTVQFIRLDYHEEVYNKRLTIN